VTEPVPYYQGTLRASDPDRNAAVEALANAYADGRLTKAEFDERSDAALQAKLTGDLARLTADLGPGQDLVRPRYAPVVATRPTWLVGIFSGSNRQGDWTVPEAINSVMVFGGFNLDMTRATFADAQVTINLVACFGGMDIVVPPGTTVIDETVSIFGGVTVKDLGRPIVGAPVLRLRGLAVFGGVTVRKDE